MLPLIYTMPAYTIAFVDVVVLTRIPETILLTARRARPDPTARQEDRGSLVVMGVVVGGAVIVAWSYQSSGPAPRLPGCGPR